MVFLGKTKIFFFEIAALSFVSSPVYYPGRLQGVCAAHVLLEPPVDIYLFLLLPGLHDMLMLGWRTEFSLHHTCSTTKYVVLLLYSSLIGVSKSCIRTLRVLAHAHFYVS